VIDVIGMTGASGTVTVQVGGVTVLSFSGPVGDEFAPSPTPALQWNDVQIPALGLISGLRIWDEPPFPSPDSLPPVPAAVTAAPTIACPPQSSTGNGGKNRGPIRRRQSRCS
jgi:hypothetical protein